MPNAPAETEQPQTSGSGPSPAKAVDAAERRCIDRRHVHRGRRPPERIQILRNLETSPLRPAARIEPRRAGRAIAVLERAAFARDQAGVRCRAFRRAAAAGICRRAHRRGQQRRSARLRSQGAGDAERDLSARAAVPEARMEFVGHQRACASRGSTTRSSEHVALIMLSVWRGAIVAQTKAKYRPALYDDERRRARPAAAAAQPAGATETAKPLPGRARRTAWHELQFFARSRKCRPARSSISTIQMSESKRISLVSRSSIACSATGAGVDLRKHAVGWPALVIGGLRRRREQQRVAVEQRQLDEDGARLFRPAPSHDAKNVLGLAAAQIGRHPDVGFDPHAAKATRSGG